MASFFYGSLMIWAVARATFAVIVCAAINASTRK